MIFEVSFECGNKVGGIWTVITTKSRKMIEIFGRENYYCIGFYNPNAIEIMEKEPPNWLKEIFRELEKEGFKFYFGEWIYANDANLILIDSKEFEKKNVNWIKGKFWELYKIDSLHSGFDYNEPLAWSYAAGTLIEKIYERFTKDILVHCHEWLSGGTILYLKWKKPKIPTIFTTHATVLGRCLGDHSKIFDKDYNPDQKCYEFWIQAKHFTEKATAWNCDVFTAVSEIIARESERILGKYPDIITPNAMCKEAIKDVDLMLPRKFELRDRIDEFIKMYFTPYYPVDPSESPIIFTSGRYEFWNKGLDLFIDALEELNKRLVGTNKTVFCFILVPTGTIGIKDIVLENFMIYRRLKEILREDWKEIEEYIIRKTSLGETIDIKEIPIDELILDVRRISARLKARKKLNPPITPFKLSYNENDDLIIKKLLENGLDNRRENPVKVIYYPVYLNRPDELLGMDYFDFVLAASIGVFPSRYEPWGYTPMETAAYLSISITTNYGGFGQWVDRLRYDPWKVGIFVVKALNRSNFEIKNQIADIMEQIVKLSRGRRTELEISAARFIRKHFTWEEMIKYYIEAYKTAKRKAEAKKY